MDKVATNVVALDSRSIAAACGAGKVPMSTTPAPSQSATPRSMLTALDGWPDAALTEIFSARSGLGELALVWPKLARPIAVGERVALIAPT